MAKKSTKRKQRWLIGNIVIGAGGTGSWLTPKLVRMKESVTLMDGDRFEKKNLDRQLFNERDIGQNKAEALARLYATKELTIKAIPEYFSAGSLTLSASDVLWCCADNHTCRREVLTSCDLYGCSAIIGANEFSDAEAYFYCPRFRGGPNDPRVFYPEILTDHSGDPLSPVGCVEAAQANAQLVIANDWASGLMLHLWFCHVKNREQMGEDTEQFFPVHNKVSMWKFTTIRAGDRNEVANAA